ncbi:homocysteine S-methyltransferase family protein [bacterium]|nr:homocysteine S-methyltransferase family protein [bacterium]
MMKQAFRERLEQGDILVADGAMGSLLLARGLTTGDPPEEWNLTRPEVLREIANLYLDAGADLIQSNSFGRSPLKLADFGLDDQCELINRRAVEIVADVVGDRAYVSGSMGPCGKILEPYGDLRAEDVHEGFLLQAKALASGGADLICIETMTDLAEAQIAIRAAKEAAPELPILATMTFDPTPRGYYTIMGQNIETAAEALAEVGADVIGSNCGNGAEGMLAIAREFRRVSDLPLLFQANAGLPEIKDGKVVYWESPEFMAEIATSMVRAGAQIIGGCCGTTPEHIIAFRRAVNALAAP